VRYGEGVLVGYRWYEARGLPVAYPFGHGLSYTTFELGAPRVSAATFSASASDTVTVDVDVTNTGARRGAEVVQCYVAPRGPTVTRPAQELKAFAKVWLDPGETKTVTLELGDRAFSFWQPTVDAPPPGRAALPLPSAAPTDTPVPGWRVDPGTYDLCIGRSSVAARPLASIEVV
jgi:beta-glucosidase